MLAPLKRTRCHNRDMKQIHHRCNTVVMQTTNLECRRGNYLFRCHIMNSVAKRCIFCTVRRTSSLTAQTKHLSCFWNKYKNKRAIPGILHGYWAWLAECPEERSLENPTPSSFFHVHSDKTSFCGAFESSSPASESPLTNHWLCGFPTKTMLQILPRMSSQQLAPLTKQESLPQILVWGQCVFCGVRTDPTGM